MLSVVTEEIKMGSLEIKWRSLGKRDRQHHRFVEIKVRCTTPKGSMENGWDRKPEYSVIVFESSDKKIGCKNNSKKILQWQSRSRCRKISNRRLTEVSVTNDVTLLMNDEKRKMSQTTLPPSLPDTSRQHAKDCTSLLTEASTFRKIHREMPMLWQQRWRLTREDRKGE